MSNTPSLLPSGSTCAHATGSRPRPPSAPSTPPCPLPPSAVPGVRLPPARGPTAPTLPAGFPHGSRPRLQIASRVRSDKSSAQIPSPGSLPTQTTRLCNTSPSCSCPPWLRRTGSTENEKFPLPFPTASGNRPAPQTQISASPPQPQATPALPEPRSLLPQPSLPPRPALHSTLRSSPTGSPSPPRSAQTKPPHSSAPPDGFLLALQPPRPPPAATKLPAMTSSYNPLSLSCLRFCALLRLLITLGRNGIGIAQFNPSGCRAAGKFSVRANLGKTSEG